MSSSCSGLSLGTMEPNCHTHGGNHCISTAPAVLSSAAPKIPLMKKEMVRGKKESETLLCSQGEEKDEQLYLAYPALLMSINFSHFKQERHHFSPPVPLFIMLCISHELSLMQNLGIVRGHPNIFNDLKQSD